MERVKLVIRHQTYSFLEITSAQVRAEESVALRVESKEVKIVSEQLEGKRSSGCIIWKRLTRAACIH